ncbi:pyruvate kinase isozyme A, chloroplastic-like isoform X1 [Zingiber officinale]|uniref:pyruvate kinase isozyme A, chloroplastic-like isoform X1 n=1 Tax=Zingiber officinale TaxID=94328 RepID=UPI001C4D48F6|nr:pyruvate kinase isozyme A, chloroplastic-like isoform X1 [Zingiber officinale]
MAAAAFAFYPHFSPRNPVARSKSRRTPIPFPGHRASYVGGRCTDIRAKCALQTGRFSFDVASEMQLKARGFMGMRKTKLVCTIGPACCSEEQLERLAMEGMNIARLNMCHSTREWHRNAIQAIRRLNEEKGFCISVMIDTAGSDFPMLDHGSASSIKTEDGSLWLFTTQKLEGYPFTIQVSAEGFSEGILVGDELVIDGGMATFEVVEKIENDLHCRCTNPGLLLPQAKLSFWRNGKLVTWNTTLHALKAKDWKDIDFGIAEGVDFISISFVNDASDIKHLKSYLSSRSVEFTGVLAKIESLKSLEHLQDIIEASDGIIIARGDLGVQVSLEEIPAIQLRITQLCRQLNKPVIVASQLLESMVEYPIPTRAEKVADVSEGVRQYADGLMLSGESAIGLFAEKALSVMKITSEQMELSSRRELCQSFIHQPLLAESSVGKIAEQICKSAVEMANNLGVDAIFVYTKRGQMASLLSRNRPNPPIFAFTDDAGARKAMTLLWGVFPLETHFSDDMESNFEEITRLLKVRGCLKLGDLILVVCDSDVGGFDVLPLFQSIQIRAIV